MENLNLKEERKRANKLIVKGLGVYFNHTSDLRFIQGLYDLQIISEKDLFYEEPMETLKRLHHYLPEFFQIEEYEDKEDETYSELRRLLEDKRMQINSLNQRLAAEEAVIVNLERKNEELTTQLLELMKRDRDMLEGFVEKLINNETVIEESPMFKLKEEN